MKIRGWFIDGFGIFRDYEVRELSDGLTVLYGPNEAGKSTLLWFIRGVLFGFPDGRSGRPQYVPVLGGRHGGRVFVAGSGGEYVIDRAAGRRGACVVTGPGQRAVTPEELEDLLGGADDRLFRSVFAFSLAELESLDSLAGNGVRERIFSAGVAGAGRSAREVIRTLNERAARLVKHHGQARVNNLVAELDRLRRRTDEARQAACEYADRVEEELQARDVVERLGGEIEGLRRERARYILLTDLWLLWRDLADARGALEELEPIDKFPADAEARLAAVCQGIEAAQRRVDELRAEQEAVEKRRGELRVDDSLRDVAGEVESLEGEIALQCERLLQLPVVHQGLAQAECALHESLGELGDEWDVARIESFDCSIPRREKIREWVVRLERVERDVEEACRTLASAEARQADAQVRRDRIVANRPRTEPPSRTILLEQQEAIRRLRAKVTEQRAVSTELTALESVLHDRERTMATLGDGHRVLPGWLVLALRLAGGAGVAVALWRVMERGVDDGVASVLLALLVVLGAAVLVVLLSPMRAVGRRRHALLQSLEAELKETQRTCKSQREKLSVVECQINDGAAALSLPSEPTVQSLEECERKLARLAAERARWDEIEARVTEADSEIEALRGEACECLQTVEVTDRARKAIGREWEAWKVQSGMPVSLTAAGGIDFFDAISRAREALEARAPAEREASRLEHALHTWEARSRAVLEACGGVREMVNDGEELLRAIRRLGERCRADGELRRTLASLTEDLERGSSKIIAAQASLARCEAEGNRLFAEAGASNEAEFRRRLHVVRQRRELGATIRERERGILARTGAGPEAESVRAELESGRLGDWQERAHTLEQRVGELQDARDEALRRDRDAETARRVLEESADIVAFDGEREAVMAELSTAVREWRVLSLARTLIEETLRKFERSRQPAVLAEASRAFASVTGGRYERIVQAGEGNDLAVLDREGRRRHTEALSRGTAEQLYICIRLGLAAEFARRSTSLPIVMDDILVNFDPARARALAEVLVGFAERHQVLLFTCHPATRDLMTAVGPKTRVVDLPVSESAV